METCCQNKNKIFVIISLLIFSLNTNLILYYYLCMYAWSILSHKRLDKLFSNLGKVLKNNKVEMLWILIKIG